MTEIRTEYFRNTSHVSQLEQPVQSLLSVPSELRTREAESTIGVLVTVVSEENVDKEKGDAL
jgi:hypothetical protein